MARRWYEIAVALKSLGSKANEAVEKAGGKKLSKQHLCTLRKVAKYPEDMGKLCDDVGVSITLHRFIAHAPNELERDERARQTIAAMLDTRENSRPDRLAKCIVRQHFAFEDILRKTNVTKRNKAA